MTDKERLDRIKHMMKENIPGHGFWDVKWLIEKVEASLTCGAVYKSDEWPHEVVCVRAPGHTEQPAETWRDTSHLGFPRSEQWTWNDD